MLRDLFAERRGLTLRVYSTGRSNGKTFYATLNIKGRTRVVDRPKDVPNIGCAIRERWAIFSTRSS